MKRMSKVCIFRTLADGFVNKPTGFYDYVMWGRNLLFIWANAVIEDEWGLLLYTQKIRESFLSFSTDCPWLLFFVVFMISSRPLKGSIASPYTCDASWLIPFSYVTYRVDKSKDSTTNDMTLHVLVLQLFFVCCQVWLSCFPTVPMWTCSSMCHRSDWQSDATTGMSLKTHHVHLVCGIHWLPRSFLHLHWM